MTSFPELSLNQILMKKATKVTESGLRVGLIRCVFVIIYIYREREQSQAHT